MKKGLAFVLTAAFCLAALTGCGSSKTETKAAERKAKELEKEMNETFVDRLAKQKSEIDY